MLARDYPHIALSCGMDDQALEFFAWGARSWVCAGSNFAPEAHIALYQTCVVEGNFTKGRTIMSAMLPLMRVLEQGGKFVQCIKYGLTLRGIDAGPPRKPLQPLNKDDKRQLAEVITTMDIAIANIMGEGA
jgi:4-hydroxy-tetrahydrodipicolinate synthase